MIFSANKLENDTEQLLLTKIDKRCIFPNLHPLNFPCAKTTSEKTLRERPRNLKR